MNNTRTSANKVVPEIEINEGGFIDKVTKTYLESIAKSIQSENMYYKEVDRSRLTLTVDTQLITVIKALLGKYHTNICDIVDEVFRYALKNPEILTDMLERKENDYKMNKNKRTPKKIQVRN